MHWFTIEKTTGERVVAAKVSYPMKACVAFLIDKKKFEPPMATASIDGDYAKGYNMILIAERTGRPPCTRRARLGPSSERTAS